MDEQVEPRKYKVTLKTGDWAIFSNDNNFDNYPARLVSGIYGIATANGGDLKITPSTVESIVEIKDDETRSSAD